MGASELATHLPFRLLLILCVYRANCEEEEQQLVFTKLSEYQRIVDTGHIAAKLDLNEPFDQFDEIHNGLKFAFDTLETFIEDYNYQKKGNISTWKDEQRRRQERYRYFHHVLSQMTLDLAGIRDDMEYVCSLTSCPATLPGASPTKSRKKRQLLGALALVNAGLSIFTLSEVEKLKTNIYGNTKDLKFLHRRIAADEGAIASNKAKISEVTDHLYRMEDWIDEADREIGVASMLTNLHVVLDNLQNYAKALIEVLLHKQVSPRFFNLMALKKALDNLKRDAEHQSLEPVYENLNELLQADVSFLVQDDELILLLHVPLSDSKQYTMYRLLDSPIRLPSGKVIRVYPRTRYLAVNADRDGFQELTEEDLRSCKMIGGRYACKAGVIAKNGYSGCLSGLFSNSESTIRAFCHFELTEEHRETVVQVKENIVQIMTPTNQSVQIVLTCQNGSSLPITVHEIMTITVPTRCLLTTPNFKFEGEQVQHIGSSFISRKLAGFNASDLEKWMDARGTGPPISFISYQTPSPTFTHDQGHSAHQMRSTNTGLNITAVICFLVFTTLAGYTVARVCRQDWKRKRKKKTSVSGFEDQELRRFDLEEGNQDS